MEKHIIKGAKKLFSLTRTKLRLAEESGTIDTRPGPLPLVKLLSGREITTVAQAKEYRDELLQHTDFSDSKSTASSVLQLMDIIEGVKYGFEPKEACLNLTKEGFREIEIQAGKDSIPINILLMTKEIPANGINLFIGENSPENSIFLSIVPTSIAGLLNFAFHSEYFSDGPELKNIVSVLGHRTLILNAIYFSLGCFGAELREDRFYS